MKQYLKLQNDILNEGVYKEAAREGMPGSLSLFGYQFRHDLSQGFPLLTTKKMYWHGIVTELIWFLKGDTNIKFLIDNKSKFWNQDAYNYYMKKCEQHDINPWPFDDFISYITNNEDKNLLHPDIPGYSFGDCGYQYGKVWRDWVQPEVQEGDFTGEWIRIDQMTILINTLRNAPEGRRHIVTAIDPIHQFDLALYWCHCLFQFNARPIDHVDRAHYAVNNGILHRNELMFPEEYGNMELGEQLDKAGVPKYHLDCQLYQRSADTFLGVPFNIASYALLTHLVAAFCNMIPGDFIHTFGDVHIYEDHYEAVHTQQNREPLKLPTIEINIKDLLDQLNTGKIKLDEAITKLDFSNFDLKHYKSLEHIPAKLSTGTGK